MLTVPHYLLANLVAHMNAVYPREGCALMFGTIDDIKELVIFDNILNSRRRFKIDDEQLCRTMSSMREKGYELRIICHSHPDGRPIPSHSDRKLMLYPDCYAMIISVNEVNHNDINIFKLVNNDFIAADYTVTA